MENKNTLTILLAIGLILVSLVAVFSFSNITLPENKERNTISVSGSSKLDAMPDQAEVYLRIETVSSTPEEAQSLNTARANKVIELLRANGLTDKEIETTGYNLDNLREWESGKLVEKGYRASHTLRLTIKNLDKVGSLMKLAIDNGANKVDSVRFGLSDEKEKEFREELLSKATEDARNKADSLAKSLDTSVKGVISVSESTPYARPYYFYDKAMVETSAAAETPMIQPESVSLTTTVNVVFEI